MNARALFYAALLGAATTPFQVAAEYVIQLAPEAGGTLWEAFPEQQSEAPRFTLFARLDSITEGGAPINTVVTLTSPTGQFESYFNHRGNSGAVYSQPDTASVVTEANGKWKLDLIDQGIPYSYEIDIAFQLPFAELPRLTSPTISYGEPLGPLDWTLEGGSSAYPGGELVVEVFTPSFSLLEQTVLPTSANSWLAPTDYDGADEYRVRISTRNENTDLNAFAVLAVRPLSVGAPEVSFAASEVVYRANLTANMVRGVVPEPNAGLLAALAIAALAHLRERHV